VALVVPPTTVRLAMLRLATLVARLGSVTQTAAAAVAAARPFLAQAAQAAKRPLAAAVTDPLAHRQAPTQALVAVVVAVARTPARVAAPGATVALASLKFATSDKAVAHVN
jgi:hypothetical protein